MGVSPCSSKNWLVRLKGLEPKKPRWAERGLGCGLSMTWALVSKCLRLRASEPQRMAAKGFCLRLFRALTAVSVTSSQPLPRWEAGLPTPTVRTRLSNITPCSAQRERSPVFGAGFLRSSESSWKMLMREGGRTLTVSATENDSPTGCEGVG